MNILIVLQIFVDLWWLLFLAIFFIFMPQISLFHPRCFFYARTHLFFACVYAVKSLQRRIRVWLGKRADMLCSSMHCDFLRPFCRVTDLLVAMSVQGTGWSCAYFTWSEHGTTLILRYCLHLRIERLCSTINLALILALCCVHTSNTNWLVPWEWGYAPQWQDEHTLFWFLWWFSDPF